MFNHHTDDWPRHVLPSRGRVEVSPNQRRGARGPPCRLGHSASAMLLSMPGASEKCSPLKWHCNFCERTALPAVVWLWIGFLQGLS